MPLGVSKPWRAYSRMRSVCRLSPLSLRTLPQIPRAAFSSNKPPPSPPPPPTSLPTEDGDGVANRPAIPPIRRVQSDRIAEDLTVESYNEASSLAKNKASSSAQRGVATSIPHRLEYVPVRPHGAFPVTIQPLDEHADPVDYKFLLKKHFVDLSGVEHHRRRRIDRRPLDWRNILQNLLTWTVVHDPEYHTVKVIVDDKTLESILEDFVNNPLDLASWSGCQVSVCSQKSSGKPKVPGKGIKEDEKPFLLLSGPAAGVTAAINSLVAGGLRCTMQKLWTGKEIGAMQHKQYVPHSFNAKHVDRWYPVESYNLTIRADEIPRPAPGTWTKESFTNYVSALVNGRVTNERRLYGHEGPPYYDVHRRVVTQLLMNLFRDSSVSHAVSLHGLKLALHYLGKNSNIDASLSILSRGRTLGLPLDATVFNLLAETAKNKSDLGAFEFCVKRMLANQVRPSFRTWRLFLDIIEAEEVRRYIIACMQRKGFFESRSNVLSVMEALAGNDAYRALQLGQNLEQFFRSQAEIYGPNWRLTTVAANKIITTFGRNGHFGLITELVKYMLVSSPSAKCKPDNHTLAILLTHVERHNRFDLAFQYIAWFEHKQIKVDEKAKILTLFKMAWRNTLPHLASAIIRYAHLKNTVPWQIKRAVLTQWLQDDKRIKRLFRRSEGFWEDGSQVLFARDRLLNDLLFWDYNSVDGQTWGSTPGEMYRLFSNWAWQMHQTHDLEQSLVPFLCEALKKDYEMETAAQRKQPYVIQPVVLSFVPRPITRKEAAKQAHKRNATNFSGWFRAQDMERVVQVNDEADGEGVWGSFNQEMEAEEEEFDFATEDDKGGPPFKTEQTQNKEDTLTDLPSNWGEIRQGIIDKFKDIGTQDGGQQEESPADTVSSLPARWKQFQEEQARGKEEPKRDPEDPAVLDEIKGDTDTMLRETNLWDPKYKKVRDAEKYPEQRVRVPKSGWRIRKIRSVSRVEREPPQAQRRSPPGPSVRRIFWPQSQDGQPTGQEGEENESSPEEKEDQT
ncbi:hypothetical protein QBC35DRAFT_489584 [Podospora australis]|uniref:Uncharacterized protein n=1 Tax=Podospora australis TaxID=1536484 RepID=A0AAN6WZY0_9PEZI|nr:hypothetical protein QBC35DRAFT_489584 [Podospora australis]